MRPDTLSTLFLRLKGRLQGLGMLSGPVPPENLIIHPGPKAPSWLSTQWEDAEEHQPGTGVTTPEA